MTDGVFGELEFLKLEFAKLEFGKLEFAKHNNSIIFYDKLP